MSEEKEIFPTDVTNVETEILSNMETAPMPLPPPPSPAQESVAPKAAWRMFIAPAWFLFGILVGLGIFAGYTQLTTKPEPAPVAALDEATVRKAAREGLLEAIRQLQNESNPGSQGPTQVDKNAFRLVGANVLGNPNAPVTIVEFADFQCPFCGRHHTAVAPTIVQEYVETGKANYVYKHLAFLGPESVYAAAAAECAADQGKFWEYHDYLFTHQQGENQGAFTKDKLIAFGKEMNLDSAQFENCVNSDETVDRVRADTEEAQQFGVQSTPTFFVNGTPLVGLKSPDDFRRAIEEALKQ